MHEGVTAPRVTVPHRQPSAPAALAAGAEGTALRGRPRSLRRSFSWMLAGNVVFSAANQGMLIVLAKLASPAVVGRYGLALAVALPIFTFATLKLRAVQATDALQEYRFGHYFGLRLLTTALALLLIAGLLPFQPHDVLLVLAFVAVAKAFESLSDVHYGLFQQQERMDCVARSLLLRGPLCAAAMAGAYLLTGSLACGAGAMALVSAGTLVGYDAPTARRLARAADPSTPTASPRRGLFSFLAASWERDRLLRLAWISLPLGFTVALGSLQKNVPRYLLAHYGGMHELGIFTALASLIGAGNLVVNSLGQSVSPRLSQLHARGDRRGFLTLVWKLMGIGAALGAAGVLVAVVAARPLLSLLYRPEYARHPEVFVWLMVAAGVDYLYLFWGSAVTAMRRFGVQFPIHAAALVVVAGVSAWSLPRLGLVGAAYGMLAGSLFCLLAYVIVALRVLPRPGEARLEP